MNDQRAWRGLFFAFLWAGGLTPVVLGQSLPTSRPVIRTGLTKHTFSAQRRQTLRAPYLLYLPEIYGKDQQPLPLILFLHGSGERGRNPDKIRSFGPPRVAGTQKGFPFIVLAPQCPSGKWWTDADVTETVMALLEETCKNYLVDTDRTYLTGMSMGGFGAWNLAQQYPDRFAALAVVCGGGNPYLQTRLRDLPTRVFHGGQDKHVPVQMAQQMVGVLKQIGGQVELLIYPKMGHNIWEITYDNPKLYEWFLEHRRAKSTNEKPASRPASGRSS